MSKARKSDFSHFEQMERIESRLSELSLIQKLLFHKYLEIAERNPSYHQKLKDLHQKMAKVEEKQILGNHIDRDQLIRDLELRERGLKFEQQNLELKSRRQKLSKLQEREYHLANVKRMYEEDHLSSPSLSTEDELMQDTMNQFVQMGLLLLALFILFSFVAYLKTGVFS